MIQMMLTQAIFKMVLILVGINMITKGDDKKARIYAINYLIEQNKKKVPNWEPDDWYNLEVDRFINGIISAGEFSEYNKL